MQPIHGEKKAAIFVLWSINNIMLMFKEKHKHQLITSRWSWWGWLTSFKLFFSYIHIYIYMTVSPMGIFSTTLICSFLPQDDQSCFSWLWFFHVTCRQNMQCHGSYGPKTQLVAGWPPNRITRLRNDPGSGRRPWDKNGGFAQYAEHAPSISKQQCSSVQSACSSKLCQSSNVTELTSIKEPKYQIFLCQCYKYSGFFRMLLILDFMCHVSDALLSSHRPISGQSDVHGVL